MKKLANKAGQYEIDLQALKESEARFRSIVLWSPDAIIVTDAKGKIEYMNPAAERVFNRKMESFVGKDFGLPLVDGKSTEVDIFRPGKDPGVGDMYVVEAEWLNKKARIITIHDITERRKLEKAQSQLAAIVESTDDAVIGKDLEGTIVSWNSGAEVVYGYNAKEVIGKSISLLMPPVHPDEYKEFLTKKSSGELIKNYETQRRRKDGQIIDVSLTISPFKDTSGKITGGSIIARDITEKKKLEKVVVKARDAAEAANKELEAFSYSVSHDLRAPLRSLDGFSQVLFEDYANQLDEQGKDYLQRIRKASQHMAELIDALLMLSRMGRKEMHYETVDLNTLAQATLAELRQTQPKRQIEFVIEEGLAVQGDSQLLRVVMENLLNNAWKYTGKQPEARIGVGALRQGDGKRTYFVCDNGAGFDMAFADKLFKAFQRLHTPNEFPGIGIGLATVQRIIHRHGGRVWAEGEVEKGATFYFTLGG